ncbi:uncharacterized protein C8A04DRAFT_38244 [Dichotomopilus funicola]|uniref:RBR-type E3 ubiquitin transferase n=1 Tax=Dichotomopilus funicola TaxID=1934379 RepID=A0AAN6V0H7_9PEZI|nr:hypothetical protein C8A04DRAFT_38244 [Dichotomopilus funicola]
MDPLTDLDEATLQVIIKAQLQDLEEMARVNAPKGKGRAGQHDPRDDLSVAINAYRDELAARSQFLADQAMCRSMASAVDADAEQIQALVSEEQRSTRDRRMAFRMGGQPVPEDNRHDHTSAAAGAVDDEVVERLRHLNISGSPSQSPVSFGFLQSHQTGADDDVMNSPESSSWAAQRRPAHRTTTAAPKPIKKMPATRECIACTDRHPINNLTRSPDCGHEYCRDCIQSLFTSALTDESLFPPRCCGQPIPLDSCRTHLTATLAGQFQAKKRELDTPNRTYCHRPTCSTWVPPELIWNQVGNCLQCGRRTCVLCKGAEHVSRDCPDDPATQQVLQLAQEQGWQRCRACQKFVELNTGCNHITCRCGAQFCYVCGLPWKTCGCAQWEERMLFNRANVVVDRNAGGQRLGARQRAEMVEQARALLVENHECDHTSWRSRGGTHRCEECNHTLPNYIYECRQCQLLACRRCRFNRL